MPIYEYQCGRCGVFEVSQRITDDPLSRCPTCKGKVKRLISNTSFQLKGSGWYLTDYARKGSGDDRKEKPASSAKDGKGTGSEASSKPGAQTSAKGSSAGSGSS